MISYTERKTWMVIASNIILMIACYFTSNFIYAPLLAEVGRDLDATNELIKATMTFYQLGALTSCLIAIFFADYFGKKNYLVTGLSLAVIGSVICMLAPNIHFLIAGRMLQGFGGATGFMMGFAFATDLFKPNETIKIVSLNGIVTSFISVFTPYAGGSIAEAYSWRATFLLMTFVFSLTLLINLVYLPAQANVRKQVVDFIQSLRQFGTIITSWKYLTYAILNGIFITGFIFSATFMSPYYAFNFAMSADEIGLIMGLSLWLSFGTGTFLSAYIYKWFGIDRGIEGGFVSIGISAVLMYATFVMYPLSLTLSITALTFYAFGFGLMYAGSIAICMRVFETMTTKASAIRMIMLTVGSFIGALSAQTSDDKNLMSLATVFIVTFLVGVVMYSLRKR